MASPVMGICKYSNLTFITKLIPTSNLESLIREFHNKFPNIPDHMFLTYSIPGNQYCVLNTQDDFVNMFTMVEINGMQTVDISLGPRVSIEDSYTTSSSIRDSSSHSSRLTDTCGREEKELVSTRMSMVWKDCIIGLNQIFSDGAELFRKELAKYSMCHGFEYIFIRNTTMKIKAVCIFANSDGNGCRWEICAKADESKRLMYISDFVSLDAHSVGCITRKTTRMSSEIVCDVVLEKIRVKPRYSPTEAKSDFQSEYNLNISYTLAHKGVEKARDMLFGEYHLSYDQLLKYSHAARESNPGSHIVFESDPETKKFVRLFVSFHPCVQGFQFCRPILYLDGTFLTNRYKGQMLCATAKDADNRKFLYTYFFC